MYYIADLHVHSPYAQATSKYLSLEQLYLWAKIKGIDVVGTGDFTHPAWLATLKEKLIPAGNGFYQLKKPPCEEALPGIRPMERKIYFCLSTEVCTIYKDKGDTRKIHHLIYAQDFDAVDQLNSKVAPFGDLAADGRPTLTLSARNLLEKICETSPDCYLIPAHIWTPWFSILGAKSGYDSIQDAYKDLTEHIFALETGLSSDPAMNWCVSDLDQYTMVSNSDAHSAAKLGREASCFNTELAYDALFQAIRTREGFQGTLEYFPEQGKYHLDGHRVCGIRLSPQETLQYNKRCPRCNRPITIGVLHRVEALSDRKKSKTQPKKQSFDYISPLSEIIAQIVQQNVNTKRVTEMYTKIINLFGNEFNFLQHVPISDIATQLPAPYSIAIKNLRNHQVEKEAGYDGVFGTITYWNPNRAMQQKRLF